MRLNQERITQAQHFLEKGFPIDMVATHYGMFIDELKRHFPKPKVVKMRTKRADSARALVAKYNKIYRIK